MALKQSGINLPRARGADLKFTIFPSDFRFIARDVSARVRVPWVARVALLGQSRPRAEVEEREQEKGEGARVDPARRGTCPAPPRSARNGLCRLCRLCPKETILFFGPAAARAPPPCWGSSRPGPTQVRGHIPHGPRLHVLAQLAGATLTRDAGWRELMRCHETRAGAAAVHCQRG